MHFNNIDNIEVFSKVEFPHLKNLELNHNNIKNLDCFDNINHFELKLLHLDENDNIDKNKYSDIILKLESKIGDFKI